MRAVFKVSISPIKSLDQQTQNSIPIGRNYYPGNTEFLEQIYANIFDGKQDSLFDDDCQSTWEQFPDFVTEKEREYMIFFGSIDVRTRIVITRRYADKATIRIQNVKLDQLEEATKQIVENIVRSPVNRKGIKIIDNKIFIHEKQEDEPILIGNVIKDSFIQTLKVDQKNFWLSVAFGLLSVFLTTILYYSSQEVISTLSIFWKSIMEQLLMSDSFWRGIVEKLLTGFTTTFFVSLVGLSQTYFDIKQKKLIDWDISAK